ncbi:dihydrofolate reductase [Thiomicrospira cyclica]|uniref:Dihydrofolate reductase n=1 Tax=Thiomicrospira cyclica (strain DSM 14477 / JCM 11371 / ALM1) TaxID=717773 RepID=F6DAC6_THICA|nr:dihydrofolate reductase [Thiomicrospira cyclica]AEG31092.1 Dihydrofolate reductase [Thiomicrospira cyclica ALM1]
MSIKQPKLMMIVAMAKNRMIGKDNQMPWHLPDDLKYFKAQTLNKPVIMGRKTFESLGARPLPNRPNLVVSRNKDFSAEGIQVFDSVESAISAVSDADEVVIMGGAQIYTQWVNKVDRLLITEVDATPQGDAFFPVIDPQAWREVSRQHHPADAQHKFTFDFVEYQNLNKNVNKRAL